MSGRARACACACIGCVGVRVGVRVSGCVCVCRVVGCMNRWVGACVASRAETSSPSAEFTVFCLVRTGRPRATAVARMLNYNKVLFSVDVRTSHQRCPAAWTPSLPHSREPPKQNSFSCAVAPLAPHPLQPRFPPSVLLLWFKNVRTVHVCKGVLYTPVVYMRR